jgi:antirestriction protein ArdC
MARKQDVYALITSTIVEQLEQGVRPWHKPWNDRHAMGRITRPLRHGGEPYKGINVILLWLRAELQGFPFATWMTLKQCNQLGGRIIKGSTSTPVVFAKHVERTGTDDQGEEVDGGYFCYRQYRVFNVEQTEGLPCAFYAPAPKDALSPLQRVDQARAFFENTGAEIREGGNRACYAIGPDHIRMPHLQLFEDEAAFEAALAHEAIHWTRHPSRLDRSFGRKRFGDEGYAMEELVAEIGSAFLSADLGIAPETRVREDHAAYLGLWLDVLKNDNRAIFAAASHAERAVRYLHGLQPAAAGKDEGEAA